MDWESCLDYGWNINTQTARHHSRKVFTSTQFKRKRRKYKYNSITNSVHLRKRGYMTKVIQQFRSKSNSIHSFSTLITWAVNHQFLICWAIQTNNSWIGSLPKTAVCKLVHMQSSHQESSSITQLSLKRFQTNVTWPKTSCASRSLSLTVQDACTLWSISKKVSKISSF